MLDSIWYFIWKTCEENTRWPLIWFLLLNRLWGYLQRLPSYQLNLNSLSHLHTKLEGLNITSMFSWSWYLSNFALQMFAHHGWIVTIILPPLYAGQLHLRRECLDWNIRILIWKFNIRNSAESLANTTIRSTLILAHVILFEKVIFLQ